MLCPANLLATMRPFVAIVRLHWPLFAQSRGIRQNGMSFLLGARYIVPARLESNREAPSILDSTSLALTLALCSSAVGAPGSSPARKCWVTWYTGPQSAGGATHAPYRQKTIDREFQLRLCAYPAGISKRQPMHARSIAVCDSKKCSGTIP